MLADNAKDLLKIYNESGVLDKCSPNSGQPLCLDHNQLILGTYFASGAENNGSPLYLEPVFNKNLVMVRIKEGVSNKFDYKDTNNFSTYLNYRKPCAVPVAPSSAPAACLVKNSSPPISLSSTAKPDDYKNHVHTSAVLYNCNHTAPHRDYNSVFIWLCANDAEAGFHSYDLRFAMTIGQPDVSCGDWVASAIDFCKKDYISFTQIAEGRFANSGWCKMYIDLYDLAKHSSGMASGSPVPQIINYNVPLLIDDKAKKYGHARRDWYVVFAKLGDIIDAVCTHKGLFINLDSLKTIRENKELYNRERETGAQRKNPLSLTATKDALKAKGWLPANYESKNKTH